MSNDQRSVRLGDVVDDYCSRCRLLMNHGVVGMVGEEIRKVRCNTCLSEHLFRHGRLPARRRNATDKLFEEVLKGIKPDAVPVSQEPPPDAPQAEPAADEPAAAESPPRPPAHPQRKLYTIRRAISDRDSAKNPKKS
ncbi:MAG TPA: hypothetical protein VFG08_02235 [Candidatus Polarisedimenticolia bacterium]|nr:hypothetical protein [Candidatus Polarisedimenticolia bacterium]